MNVNRFLILASALTLSLLPAKGQVAGGQTGTPLKVACNATWTSASVTCSLSVSLTGGLVNPLFSSSGSYTPNLFNSPSTSQDVNTANGVIEVQSGAGCTLSVYAPQGNTSAFTVSFTALPGYTILINGTKQSQYTFTGIPTTVTNPASIIVTVLAPTELKAKAGTASSITSGQIYWQVALGGLLNGTSAGSLKIIDSGLEPNWVGVFTPADLQYETPSAEVIVYKDPNHPGNIRQISAPQVFVDIITNNSTSYTINFYNQNEITVSGTTPPLTFTSANSNPTPVPFISYTISQVNGQNELEIVSTAMKAGASVTTGTSEHVAQTTLTRTGSAITSFGWVLDDWYTQGQSALVEEQREWGTNSNGNETESYVLYQPPSGSNAPVLTVNYTFSTASSTPWGMEVIGKTLGSSAGSSGTLPSLGYGYVNASTTNGYGLLQEMDATDESGSWAEYDYYGTSSGWPMDGALNHIYKPFLNSPTTPSASTATGEVTTLGWAVDLFGMPTRLQSEQTSVNGTLTSSKAISYQDVNNSSWAGSGANMVDATITTDVSTGTGGTSLTSYLKYFNEQYPDDFYTGQIYSTTRADGVMTCYAYMRGTLTLNSSAADTFSISSNAPPASCVAVINGTTNSSASNATEATSFLGCPIDPVYLIAGESTATVTMRDSLALVRSVQKWAWLASGWVVVGYVNCTYDTAGQLTGTSAMNGATTADTYTGDQHVSHTDETGVTVHYTYDYAGRLQTFYKTTGPVTTYAYDAAGRTTSVTLAGTNNSIVEAASYDDAGRMITRTPAGLSAFKLSYYYGSSASSLVPNAATGAAMVTATTYPDTSVRYDAITADGRKLAVAGTAVVENDYTYTADTNGYFETKTFVAGSTSLRWVDVTTNMLGETVTKTQPGFDSNNVSNANYVESYDYDANDHLTEIDRTGLAPIKYLYDAMGLVIRGGIDSNSDGLGTVKAPSTVDRMADQLTYVESLNGAYWLHQEIDAYPTAGSSTSFPVSITRRRLTGFTADLLAETDVTDAYGNVTATTVNTPSTGTNGTATVTTNIKISGASSSSYTAVETYSNGLKVSVEGFDGFTTNLGYDTVERPSTVTDPRNNTTTTNYETGSYYVLNIQDPSKINIANYGYDALGRVNTFADAGTNTTHYNYTLAGQLQYVFGSGSNPVAYGYNAYGDCNSQTTYRSGNFTGSTWPNPSGGDETQWIYDAGSGLLATKTDPANQSVQYTYDTSDRLQKRTWARGTSTTYVYDGKDIGDLYQVNYSDTTTPLQFTYTRSGEISTVADYTGTRTVNYTNANQPLELTNVALAPFYGSNLVETRLYNSDGLLPGRPSGFSVGTSSLAALDLSQSYNYNSSGQFQSVVSTTNNGANSTTFKYNYLSNVSLVQSLQAIQATTTPYVVNYQYDATRDLVTEVQTQWTGASTPTLAQFDYVYNGLRQRQSEQKTGLAFQDYYEGVNSYSSVFNYYQYDAMGELSNANMYTGSAPAAGSGPTSSSLPSRFYGYSYDNQGNRIQAGPGQPPYSANDAYMATSTGATGADSLNQYYSKEINTQRILGNASNGATVTSNVATLGVTDRNFGGLAIPPTSASEAMYNPVSVNAYSGGYGTAINTDYLVPPQPQLYTFDLDGNLHTDGIWTYTYDAENRVVTMTSGLSAGVGSLPAEIDFNYDYLGRRVEKIVKQSGSTVSFDRRYLYDGWNLIAELDTSGDFIRSYTWGLDVSQDLTAAGGVGALLELTNSPESSSAANYFTAFDGNGNVAALINANSGANYGMLAAVYEYSPFGEQTRNESPNPNDLAVQDNPFRFATKFTDYKSATPSGSFTDLESKFVNFGTRLYDPATGRFTTRDPIGEDGGINLYNYCGNDGINGADYLGMDPPGSTTQYNYNNGISWQNYGSEGWQFTLPVVGGYLYSNGLFTPEITFDIQGYVLNGKLNGPLSYTHVDSQGWATLTGFYANVTNGLLAVYAPGQPKSPLYNGVDSGAGPAKPPGGSGTSSGNGTGNSGGTTNPEPITPATPPPPAVLTIRHVGAGGNYDGAINGPNSGTMPTGFLNPGVVEGIAESISSQNGAWIDTMVRLYGKGKTLDFLDDAIPQYEAIVTAHKEASEQLIDGSSYLQMALLVNKILSPTMLYRIGRSGRISGVGSTDPRLGHDLIFISQQMWNPSDQAPYQVMSAYFSNISVYGHEYTHYLDKRRAVNAGKLYLLRSGKFWGASEARAYQTQVILLKEAADYLK